MTKISDQVNKILEDIHQIALRAGRDPETVKLIAVSKTRPPAAIREAYEAGQRRFGENRVQELESKVGGLPEDIEWHLIGHLQGNKAAKAVKLAACIHSVDSLKLLERLNRLAGENQQKPDILLELNLSGESSKFGVGDNDEVWRLATAARQAEHLAFTGLMTMAPFNAEPRELHRIFAGLREWRDQLQTHLSTNLPELSMGMSGDYKIAIQEGATMVRIGTAIFGTRL